MKNGKVSNLKKKYEKEERRHDIAEEREEAKHERRHDKSLNKALKIGKLKKKKK